jgi:hypothetical protein
MSLAPEWVIVVLRVDWNTNEMMMMMMMMADDEACPKYWTTM